MMMFLITSITLVTSCSKDEPKQTEQSVSVENTVWKSESGTLFKFYANGKCELDGIVCDYQQVGNEVNIKGHLIYCNNSYYYTRYAYVNGNIMDVELYFVGEPTFIVKFYKVN